MQKILRVGRARSFVNKDFLLISLKRMILEFKLIQEEEWEEDEEEEE